VGVLVGNDFHCKVVRQRWRHREEELVTDEYARSGEFLDVLSRDAWAGLAEPVTAALAGARPAAGPLVDLGAGSGLGTRVLAGCDPDAAVLAVEPSAVQRAVLLARAADDPILRGRLTVVADTAQTARLPERLGAVLAMNMLGHLRPAERRALWRRLADRLAPGAPLVLNVQPPARAEAVPDTAFASVQVGRQRYVGGGRAEPDGPDAVVWHMRYQVCGEDGAVLRDVAAAYRWHVVTPEEVAAELTAAGLEVRHGPMGLIRAARAHR
jgi:hypothetical protein